MDRILEHEKPDRALFLGDHFDDFGDNPGMNRRMALWIKARMAAHPEDIWVWGNHDLSYAFPGLHTGCSGYDEAKSMMINDVLLPEDWAKFQLYYWLAPGWLVTHAGLTSPKAKGLSGEKLEQYLAAEAEQAKINLKHGSRHWMYSAGKARWGREDYGGITWCDFNDEFSSISGVNQIFGHTIVYKPAELHTETSKNYNLDTNSAWYGLWNGTELKLKCVRDEIPARKA